MSLSQGEASRGQRVLEDKHKIFLSHIGAERDFVLQLIEDFKNWHRYPFFDMTPSCFPRGERYRNLIIEAIQQCDVALVVLSEECFTRSVWPMTELVEIMKSKKRIVPIFLGVSPADLKEEDNVGRWLSIWEAWKERIDEIDIGEWMGALEELRKISGHVYKHEEGFVGLRMEIVEAVNAIVPAWSARDDTLVEGRSRICELQNPQLLNCDDHVHTFRKHKQAPARYQRGILHQVLEIVSECPTDKADKSKGLHVHTKKNVLTLNNPHNRIPRPAERSVVDPFEKLAIRARNAPDKLLKVVKQPVTGPLPLATRRIADLFKKLTIGAAIGPDKLMKVVKQPVTGPLPLATRRIGMSCSAPTVQQLLRLKYPSPLVCALSRGKMKMII